MLLRPVLLVTTLLSASPVLAASGGEESRPAATKVAANDDATGDADGDASSAIVVTARRLDAARDRIDPALGANDYTITRAQLDNQPGGPDRSLKAVLLQAPGVSQDADGDGDIHIRNEHGNVQYRLNGITVPQGYEGFGALVDPRIASTIEIITGALPAQYGIRTAGVVNMKTRTDSFDFDGDVGIYGGAHGTIQPSATIRDGVGSLNYFASGSYLRSDAGISNPAPSADAIHDRTEQYRGFGYLAHLLGSDSRVTAFGGISRGTFQIPDSPGQIPQYTYRGRTTFDSTLLDQNQTQQSEFGVLSFEHTGGKLDLQVAPFVRYAKARYTPDPAGGQLLFNGADTALTQASFAYGAQADAGYQLSGRHTLRGGLYWQHERTTTDSINRVFAVDAAGNQASDVPRVIPIASAQTGTVFSAYLQDEWKPLDTVTVNIGLRYDRSDAVVSEDQLSPRGSVVWKPGRWTTFHAGYARYFTPPPIEIAVAREVAAFDGTTGAFASRTADPIRAEREHNFDVGLQQFLTPRLSVTTDVYYKLKSNLLDEEHFGSTIIQSPFNYAKSWAWGAELGVNYEGPVAEFYANLARGEQKAKDIVSNQFFFDPGDLAYIADHYIYTDHSQKWTGSAGGALKLEDSFGKLTPAFDLIYGSGLRTDDPAGIVPNGGTQRPYVQFDLGIAQQFGHNDEKAWTLRVDVVNLFDHVYLIRDGSGVGAGQPEYGPRRGIFAGLRKSF
ncbi:MAG: TonB-dependent receptor [Croceibacterium sp.]